MMNQPPPFPGGTPQNQPPAGPPPYGPPAGPPPSYPTPGQPVPPGPPGFPNPPQAAYPPAGGIPGAGGPPGGGYQPYAPPPPPPAPKRGKGGLVFGIILLVVLALAAAGYLFTRGKSTPATSPSPFVTPSTWRGPQSSTPVPPPPPPPTKMQIGACLDNEAEMEKTEPKTVPCTKPHKYEFYYRENLTLPNYTNKEEIGDLAKKMCRKAFTPYVGLDLDSSKLDVTSVWPSSSTWADGDREVLCFLESPTDVTTSLKGSKK